MFFPFIVIIIKYFYAEKENSYFYNKEVNPCFFPLPLILSESCFLKNFKYNFQAVKNNMHKNKQVSTMHNPPSSWHLWHHIIVSLPVNKSYLGNVTLPDVKSDEEIKKTKTKLLICSCVYTYLYMCVQYVYKYISLVAWMGKCKAFPLLPNEKNILQNRGLWNKGIVVSVNNLVQCMGSSIAGRLVQAQTNRQWVMLTFFL